MGEIGDYLAVDGDFVRLNPEFKTNKILIFARCTPQTKANIVKRRLNELESTHGSQPWWGRMTGPLIGKVGMVGDGVNDLLAMREADIGIGVSQSSAVYGCDFTVSQLEQIEVIIRESRCCERKLLEVMNYDMIIHVCMTIIEIYMTPDLAGFTFLPGSYRNFTCVYLILGFQLATAPSLSPTPYRPSVNVVSWHNQLLFWGVLACQAVGVICSMAYYQGSG